MFMGSRRDRIHPRECLDEVFNVLTSSFKIWIPFILLSLISLFMSSILGFTPYLLGPEKYHEIFLDSYQYFYLIHIGGIIVGSFLPLLIIPTYMLMFRDIVRGFKPSFKWSFKKGIKSFWKLFAVIMIRYIILVIVTLPLTFLNIYIIRKLGLESAFELSGQGILGLPALFISPLITVFFIFVLHSVVLGKKGVKESLKESFMISKKNYWNLYVLLLIFNLIVYILSLSLNVINQYYDLSWALNVGIIIVLAIITFIIGVYERLTFVSFYLKNKKLEKKINVN